MTRDPVAEPVRLLIAIDGSECSSRAVELVASIRWPPGTSAHLLAVAPAPPEWGVIDAGGQLTAHRSPVESILRASLDQAASRLSDRLTVQASVRHGRPASVILQEASAVGADLIVVGSRGRGPFETMLLGSVSAEVIDRADCPVLVARRASGARILVADDGSDGARAIVDALCRWRAWRGAHAVVASVAPSREGDAPARHAAWAEQCLTRLRACGISGESRVPIGDPAHELVRTADLVGADLLITGSRGHSGIRRLLLGSVARNVVLHATCSVLVVRGPRQRAAVGERVPARAVSLASGSL